MSVADTGVQKVRKTSRVLHQWATWRAWIQNAQEIPEQWQLHSRSTNVVKGATQNWVRRPERILISRWETNPLENIVVQKSHEEFYILISSLELQKTTCLTTCSSFPWLEVLWVMCSNEFQIVLLCTNHTLVKPILNLA